MTRVTSSEAELIVKVRNYEIMLQAKDEEIHYLKTQMTGYSMMFDEPQDAKARSIVAMMFWEWKSGIKYIESQYDKGIVEGMRYSFHKAYKMLKDNQ